MKKYFVFLLIFYYASSQAQKLNLTGENYLLLNGERFKNKKIVFAKADGDWFATAKDGHGALSLNAPFDGRELRLDLEWDGKEEEHIITNDIRHEQRKGEFIVTLPDKDVYGDGLNAYPGNDDEIKIIIHHADESTVSGEITGTMTEGTEKVKVTGNFNLKKVNAGKKIVNSSYKDCDNVVHDKLIGAEGRSPSECEAKYDLDIRSTIHDAVDSVVQQFQSQEWEIQNQTTLSPLTIVARGSEKEIFNTTYELNLQAKPASATYAGYQKRYDDLSEQLKEVTKESYDQFMKFSREMNGAVNIHIYISVNNYNRTFGNYKGGARISKIAATIYKIQSPYVQARTGGGEESSMNATFLFIGNWKHPVIEKLSDGGEDVTVVPVLNPGASHLQPQNIFIRIECNPH